MEVVARAPMSGAIGYRTILLACVLVAILDGIDVLAVSYTASSIAGAWRLAPSALGYLFGAGLLGMVAGSALLAPLGDRFGRRPVILVSIAIMTLGSILCAVADSPTSFAAMRMVTGLGIGAALMNANVLLLEYAPDQGKKLAAALFTIGYPLGGAIGAAVAAVLIPLAGWRSVYLFCTLFGLAVLPLAWRYIPESLEFLGLGRRPGMTIERPVHPGMPAVLRRLFRPPYALRFAASLLMSFCLYFVTYFLLNWTPQILTKAGLGLTGGISASMLMNIGGGVGCLVFGACFASAGRRPVSVFFLGGMFVTAVIFGLQPVSGIGIFLAAAAIGFFVFSAIAASYAFIPTAFPTELRTTASGLTIGVGRLGGVVGPVATGYLIEAGWSRAAYFALLSSPMLLGALCALAIGQDEDRPGALPPPADDDPRRS